MNRLFVSVLFQVNLLEPDGIMARDSLKVRSIGVDGGLGESVNGFDATPAEEIDERLTVCALTLGRRKRVEHEGLDSLKRRRSRTQDRAGHHNHPFRCEAAQSSNW